MEIFVVGGFNRDTLLGKTPKDKDFLVLNSSEEEMLSLGFKRVGAAFPVFLDENGDEYALARKERKSGEGYNGFTIETNNVTLEEDLLRRDLTINTICFKDGQYIDPLNGMKDLENKILKHASPAFAEDPLRVLRLARFSAKYPDFKIYPETKALAFSLKEELRTLTRERVFKELNAVMTTEKPSNFFRTLLDLNVLDAVFPVLYEMSLINHNSKYHLEGTVFEHTMRVLDNTTTPLARFGALYHDIGKPFSFKHSGTFHSHIDDGCLEEAFIELEKEISLPNEISNFIKLVSKYHHHFHNFKGLNKRTVLSLFLEKHLKQFFDEMIEVVDADAAGRLVGEEFVELSTEEVDLFFTNPSENISSREDKIDKRVKAIFLEFLSFKPDTLAFINEYKFNKEKDPEARHIKEFIHRQRLNKIDFLLRKIKKDPS